MGIFELSVFDCILLGFWVPLLCFFMFLVFYQPTYWLHNGLRIWIWIVDLRSTMWQTFPANEPGFVNTDYLILLFAWFSICRCLFVRQWMTVLHSPVPAMLFIVFYSFECFLVSHLAAFVCFFWNPRIWIYLEYLLIVLRSHSRT